MITATIRITNITIDIQMMIRKRIKKISMIIRMMTLMIKVIGRTREIIIIIRIIIIIIIIIVIIIIITPIRWRNKQYQEW